MTIVFHPANQSDIAGHAADIMVKIEGVLPKVPWFSNSGQQEAFCKTVELANREIESADADKNAKEAMLFWVLALLYANSRPFRLATASTKNWRGPQLSPMAKAFVGWAGTNMHPAQAIAAEIMGRQTRELTSAIGKKVMAISTAKRISEEEAYAEFKHLLTQATEKHLRSGVTEMDAEEKALRDVLAAEIQP